MEFRRINGLPPYVFGTINALRDQGRRAGDDVIDLAFGNPDIPSPRIAVEKLAEAATHEKNHRYSASRGIPNLRKAICSLYQRRFGVELDPETEAITTIGAKEGFSHLMLVLLAPGDAALVPSPSYPIHIWGPALAGADIRSVPMTGGQLGDTFFDDNNQVITRGLSNMVTNYPALFALGLFNIGWLVLAVPAWRQRAWHLLDRRLVIPMLTVAGVSIVLWIALMYSPKYSATVILAGSYATWMLLYLPLGALLATMSRAGSLIPICS